MASLVTTTVTGDITIYQAGSTKRVYVKNTDASYIGSFFADANAVKITAEGNYPLLLHTPGTLTLNSGGSAALTLDGSQNATFKGELTVEGDFTNVENLYVNQESVLDGHTYPYADSSYTLGTSALRWSTIYGDTAILGNADGTGLLLGVSAFGGAVNQRLQIGATLAGSSSAVAQINGLLRTSYIITHNTSEGIRPNADGQSTCGTSAQRWSNVYSQLGDFNSKVSIGTSAFGATTAKLLVGAFLADESSAIAQFNGFIRADYMITHNSTYGIYPNTDGQGSVGYSSRRYGSVWSGTGNFSGNCLAPGWQVSSGGSEVGSIYWANSGMSIRSGNSGNAQFILKGGSVGIGTTTPATPLHVWSTSYPQFRVSYNSSLYFTLDHAATLNVYGNDWYVRLNSSEKFRIKQDGSAIFTGDLTCADDLYLNATNAWIIAGRVGNALTGGTLRIQNFGELEVDGVLDINGTGTSTFAGALSVTANAYSCFSGGNLAIGSTDGYGGQSSGVLHLQHNTSGGVISMERQDSSLTGQMGLIVFGTRNYDDALCQIRATCDSTATTPAGSGGYLSFDTEESGGNLTERMRIQADGNVGIATTAPAATLDVRRISAAASKWTAAFCSDNQTLATARAHDSVLIQASDVPCLKIYEAASTPQVATLAVGDGNATLASSNTLRFYVNGSNTGDGYNGLGGTRALLLNSAGAATFVGSVTAVSFSGSGASLTTLNATNLSSGTVATARLGSGTASSSTFLRGDSTWASAGTGTVTGTGTDNYVPRWNGTTALQNSSIFAKDDGNVGIGLATPASLLQLKGDGTLMGSSITIMDSGENQARFYAGLEGNERGYLSLVDNDGTTGSVYITGDDTGTNWILGKIGIGTNVASEVMDIETGDGGGHIELNNPDSGGNSFVIGITDTAAPGYGVAGSLFIRDGASSRFVLTSDGNVGIGTTTPAAILNVAVGAYSNVKRVLILNNTNTAAYAGAAYDSVVINQEDVPCIRLRETPNNVELTLACGNENSNSAVIGTTGMLRFATGRAVGLAGYSSSGTGMVIKADGNVGIGTVTPEAPFHVHKDSSTAVRLVRGATDGQVIQFYRGSSISGNIQVRSSGLALGGGSSEDDIFIDTAGKVGINDITPGYQLDVNGTFRVTGAATFDNPAYLNSTGTGIRGAYWSSTSTAVGSLYGNRLENMYTPNYLEQYLAYHVPTKFEVSNSSGSSFSDVTVTDSIAGIFNEGTYPTNQYTWAQSSNKKIRFSFTSFGYKFVSCMALRATTASNTITMMVEKSSSADFSSGVVTVFTSTGMNGWPGFWQIVNTWHNSGNSAAIRITLESNQANSNNVTVNNINCTGGYSFGAGRRIYTGYSKTTGRQMVIHGPTGININPDSWLHIEDDSTLTKHLLHLKGGGASGAYGMLVEAANGTDLFNIDTLSYKVTMPSGYPVGIGTTNPTRTLQVAGAAHATSHLVGSLTTALGIAGSFPDANDSELGPGYLVMTRDDTAAAKQLQFWKNGSLHSYLETSTSGLKVGGTTTFANNVIVTGYLQPLGNTNYNDNKQALFGNGNDLQIYHDGSQSYIKQAGTGQLRIATDAFLVSNEAVTENIIWGAANGTVELYYNSSKKLETTNTGVTVTGGATFSGNFNFDGNGTFGTGSNGAGNTSSIPAVSHYVRGYSVQYDSGGSGARLTNTGFLTWWTGGGWTSNERMWSLTNAYAIDGRFALLKGSNNSTIPTLGNNGALGTNTSAVCWWDKDGVFTQNGDINLTGDIGVANGRGVRGPSATEQLILNTTDGIKLTSGGTERVRIETDGNVGIGTTNPGSYKLNVNGQGRFADSVIISNNKFIHTNDYACNTNWRNMTFTGPSESAYHIVLTGANVGIGTATPAGQLHVYDNYAGERNIYFDNYNASGVMQLNIRAGTGNEYLSLSRSTTLAALWVAGDPFVIKHHHSSAWHDSITVDGVGRIGINRFDPSYNLDVNGTGRFTGTTFVKSTDDNGGKADFVVGTGGSPQISLMSNQVQCGGTDQNWYSKWLYDGHTRLYAWNSSMFFAAGYTSTARDMEFWVGTGANSNVYEYFGCYGTLGRVESKVETCLATSSGSVGIGTTDPSRDLDVDGTTRLRGALYDKNNSYGTSGQVLSTTGSGGVDWVSASGGGSGTVTSVATSTGLTGGTITTSGTLSVSTSVCMSIRTSYNNTTSGPSSRQFTFSSEGSVYALADGYSTVKFSSYSSSDYRLKKNISTFNSEAWTKVKSVNLRKFDFDESAIDAAVIVDKDIVKPSTLTQKIGFIAHELSEAGIDGAVAGSKDEIDADGNAVYQRVDPIKLIPVMWGALNEAITKIETLETKVQTLENN